MWHNLTLNCINTKQCTIRITVDCSTNQDQETLFNQSHLMLHSLKIGHVIGFLYQKALIRTFHTSFVFTK